jgi:flavin-dependent dehydrogenase
MTSNAELDAIILGGGPAGSAAAIELALAGRRVALLERTLHAHDKVCGDFLSHEALSSLHALGLDTTALGALPIHYVRFAGALGLSSTKLPFAAQSLTRRTLDDALLNRASAAGALVLRGHTAESLHRADGLWHVSIAGHTQTYTLTAPNILLATGKHDLRGLPRSAPASHPELIGLKMYLRLAPSQAAALADAIELILLPHGYAGHSLIPNPAATSAERDGECNTANLCFVLQRDALRSAGRSWSELARFLGRTPHLRRRLAGAEPLLARPLAISPIPYGLLRREAIADGLVAIGDQAAVIPSFTGDGLAIALHTGRLAAQFLLAGRPARAFHAELYAQLRTQLSLATALSRALLAQPQRGALSFATRVFPTSLRLVAARTRVAPQHQLPGHPVASAHENTCAVG